MGDGEDWDFEVEDLGELREHSPGEARHFFRKMFAEYAARAAEIRILESHPGSTHPLNGGEALPAARLPADGPIDVPDNLEAEGALEVAERAVALRDLLADVGKTVIEQGTKEAREKLRDLGYSPADIILLVRRARDLIQKGFAVDELEQARAIQIARYERTYKMAIEACDLKNAISALKGLDRVYGLSRDPGTNPLEGFAELIRRATNKDPGLDRLRDVEVISSTTAADASGDEEEGES